MKIAAKKTSLTVMIISSNLSKRSHSEIANKKKQDKSHLAEYVSSSELATRKAVVPKNTQKNTGWALHNFSEWMKEWEKRYIGEKCLPGLFDSLPWDVAKLNHWN